MAADGGQLTRGRMEIDSANSALPQGSCFQVDRLQKSLERSAISVSMVMLSGRMVPSRNCLADACRIHLWPLRHLEAHPLGLASVNRHPMAARLILRTYRPTSISQPNRSPQCQTVPACQGVSWRRRRWPVQVARVLRGRDLLRDPPANQLSRTLRYLLMLLRHQTKHPQNERNSIEQVHKSGRRDRGNVGLDRIDCSLA